MKKKANALFGIINCCGGTGNTLALCVMGLFSKSEQLKAVSKAAIVPGLFNINEPVIFGYPIMYNPIMCIPFILNPVITMMGARFLTGKSRSCNFRPNSSSLATSSKSLSI